MKKVVLLMVLSCLVNITYGKYSKGITTEEEYLYMSKGYKVAVESGLDLKAGYKIGKTYSQTISLYTFEYKTLLKVNGQDTTEVGYIVKVVAKTLFGPSTYWFGIPMGNQVLLDQFFATLYSPANEGLAKPLFKSYATMKEIEKI
jgi:hypothetical protein